MRVFDYYEKLPDASNIDEALDGLVEDVFSVFDNLVGGEVIGKYEPKTPGEKEEPTGVVVDEDSMVITSPDIDSTKHSIFISDVEEDDKGDDEVELEKEEKDKE